MLEAAGINPERIAESSQQRFGVEVSYARPDGQVVKIKGFDVAPEFHAQKGGSVSAEFTAQMVIVYKILADFYYTKGMVAKYRSYLAKADEYLAQLGNMVISSVSSGEQGESCLPFATQDNVSTGNGRVISQASSRGSIASTAYTLFAYYNYNPLELKQ